MYVGNQLITKVLGKQTFTQKTVNKFQFFYQFLFNRLLHQR